MDPGAYMKDDLRERLLEAIPDAEKRFNRYCKNLKKLMDEIQKFFPEAHYHAVDDRVTVMLYCPNYNDPTNIQKARALEGASDLSIGCGNY